MSDPCAVYNFYNCCNDGGSSSANTAGAEFIWQSANIIDPSYTAGSAQEPLNPAFTMGNSPNAALKASLGLLPLHRKARLKDVALLRFADQVSGSPYTSSINFDLVVLDFSGAFIRKISTTTLDYKLIPLKVWTPIPLSTAPGTLDALPGELIVGQLTFGAAMTAGSFISGVYQLSGTGILLP